MPSVKRVRPRPYDDATRYWVPSRTVPGKEYLVQFTSYDVNGECQCKHFEIELLPLIKRGITAADAVAGGLVALKDWQRPEDALRCYHICDGLLAFAEDFTREIILARDFNRTTE